MNTHKLFKNVIDSLLDGDKNHPMRAMITVQELEMYTRYFEEECQACSAHQLEGAAKVCW